MKKFIILATAISLCFISVVNAKPHSQLIFQNKTKYTIPFGIQLQPYCGAGTAYDKPIAAGETVPVDTSYCKSKTAFNSIWFSVGSPKQDQQGDCYFSHSQTIEIPLPKGESVKIILNGPVTIDKKTKRAKAANCVVEKSF